MGNGQCRDEMLLGPFRLDDPAREDLAHQAARPGVLWRVHLHEGAARLGLLRRHHPLRLPEQGVDEEPSAHADAAVDPPDRELDAVGVQRLEIWVR